LHRFQITLAFAIDIMSITAGLLLQFVAVTESTITLGPYNIA